MDDESGMQEGGGDLQHQASSNVQDGDEDGEEDASQEDLSISSEDHSFLYGNPVSSTPLAKKSHKHQKGGNAHHHHAPPSMDSPADSPFEMLDRKLKEKLQFSDDIDDGDDRGISSLGDTPSLPSGYDDYSGRIQQRSSYDDYEEEPSVLISRQDLPAAAAAPSSQEDKSASATPKAATAKKASAAASKVPAATTTTTTAAASPARNPFTKGNERWNGIADLRNTPLNPKIRRPPSAKKSIPPPPGTNFDITDTFDDEPEEDLALGMSPPVTMNFGIPGAGGGGGHQKFSRTPAKEATKLIIDDLMKEMSGLSPSPGVPTPPAFAKYANYENLSAAASPSFSRSRQDVGEEDELTIQQGGDVGGDSFEEEGASTVGMGRRGVPTESFVDEESFEGSERSTLDILRRSGPAAANQHDLMAFSPASSEAASVFGGPKSYRSQGFALMRQDEMETYHGGVSRAESGKGGPCVDLRFAF